MFLRSLKIAAKILYQYVKLTQEKGLGLKSVFLREVVESVINQEYEDYALLSEFESQLANGWLYSSLGELLTARMEGIKEQIRKADLLEKALDKVKHAVKDFINAELQEDYILLLLNSQLISAYLITTTSRKPAIKGIIDGALVDLCQRLAKDNPMYKKFLLLESEERVTGGRYTRVGLVPPKMTFEEFSETFHRLFTKASENYVSLHDLRDRIEDYSAHLIRIFPSGVAFKLVKGGIPAFGAKIDPLHPVHVIKKLMIEKLGLISNLEFIASLKVEEPRTIAMKSVITTIINTKTSTYLLTKQAIGSVLSSHSGLLKNMKNRAFDAILISRSGCDTLSELTIRTHRNYERASPEEKAILRKKFFENVKELVSSYRSRLDPDELHLLSNAIFTMLNEIGTILAA